MDLLKFAAHIAKKKKDQRYFLVGAVAIRSDGAVVHATNSATKIPTPGAHAEARLMARAGTGSTVFVARALRGTGELGLAKPCARCLSIMRSHKVKKVYYTISSKEYGVIKLDTRL